MIKSAIEKILSLAEVTTLEGFYEGDKRVFCTKDIFPIYEPEPQPLIGSTLSSLADYAMMDDIDGYNQKNAFLHIVDHRKVSLMSSLYGPHRQRCAYFTSTFGAKDYPYGQFIDIESFIVAMQTYFVQDDNTSAILRIVGNVTHEAKLDVTDNGYSQVVTAKTGIARVGNVDIPNPVALRPYRTFLEVESQPSCLFVFRMRKTDKGIIECALFEADAGLWKLEAIKSIRIWLAENISHLEIVG